jgi:hypothetical protein
LSVSDKVPCFKSLVFQSRVQHEFNCIPFWHWIQELFTRMESNKPTLSTPDVTVVNQQDTYLHIILPKVLWINRNWNGNYRDEYILISSHTSISLPYSMMLFHVLLSKYVHCD